MGIWQQITGALGGVLGAASGASSNPTVVAAATGAAGSPQVRAAALGTAEVVAGRPAPVVRAPSSGLYTLRWVLAWSVVIVLFVLVVRGGPGTVGDNTVYYLAVLTLLLLILTQYRWLTNALSPISGVVPA